MFENERYSRTTERAVRAYGLAACIRAYRMHLKGEGARTIAQTGPGALHTTRQADSAINAGREVMSTWLQSGSGTAWRLDATPLGRTGTLFAEHRDTGERVQAGTLDVLGRMAVAADARRAVRLAEVRGV